MIVGLPVHADSWNGDDRTLCGEAFEGEDGHGSVLLVCRGQAVTCDLCKRIIAYCQDKFTGNYRPRVQLGEGLRRIAESQSDRSAE